MINKKNKIVRLSAWLGAFIIAVVLLVCPFLFAKSNNSSFVSAETVVVDNSIKIDGAFIGMCDYDDVDGQPNGWLSHGNKFGLVSFEVSSNLSLIGRFFTMDNDIHLFTLILNYGWNYAEFRDVISGYFFRIHYNVSEYFNFSLVSSVSFSVVDKWNTHVWLGFDFIIYDTQNNLLYISFMADLSGWTLPVSDYNSPLSLLFSGSSLTDNTYYNQGYSDGYNAGESVSYDTGYRNGYNIGYSNGEQHGYNVGLSSGGDVSFTNLIGSVVDVPVKAFSGLLDFDLRIGDSSFNLKGFMIAILTVAIIIAFVRIILAK